MTNSTPTLKHFRFWCQKVLPLVYDDSLSYYEVLCKVITKLNEMVDQINQLPELVDEVKTEIANLQAEIANVQEFIDNFDSEQIAKLVEKLIQEQIATMIFVTISDAGYIIYHIPENWDDIHFKTTGLDINVPDIDYGHLVLTY